MKFLIITFLVLASCASEPQPVPAPALETATAAAAADISDVVATSPSELAAITAEQDFLDEMSNEGIYPETTPTQITVKYHRSGLTIGLYNESYISQTDYYQQKRSTAVYKVVPDIKMGALIHALTDLDFFDIADVGRKRHIGSSVTILFRRGTENYTLAWGPNVNPELFEATNMSADSIRLMYDTTRSIQLIENNSEGDFFQNESDRINNQNAQQRVKPRK
ncbi:MAG: hypothetical protein H8E25_06905 [Planctomycetes bacterium]|nr:hypothetical protein [Planctomycetota bacterium]